MKSNSYLLAKLVAASLAVGVLAGCSSSSDLPAPAPAPAPAPGTVGGSGVDPYLENCAVTMYNASGTALGTGVTGTNGSYNIAGLPNPLPAGAYVEIVGGGACVDKDGTNGGAGSAYPATSKLQAAVASAGTANITPFTTLAKASGLTAAAFAAKLGLTEEQLLSDPMQSADLAAKSAALGTILSLVLAQGVDFNAFIGGLADRINVGGINLNDTASLVSLTTLALTQAGLTANTDGLTAAINTAKTNAANQANQQATACTVGAGGVTGAGSIISVGGQNVCAFITGAGNPGSICSSTLLTGAGTVALTGSSTYYCAPDAGASNGSVQ